MMQYLFHKKFIKKFLKLRENIKKQFFHRLRLFAVNPFDELLNNHSVDKVYVGCRSINVNGDVRAIYEDRDGVALFVNIGTHSELY